MDNNGEQLAKQLSKFVNTMYNDQEDQFIEKVMSDHRTLQQSTFRLFLKCIEAWSKADHYDLRNEATVKLSKKIMEVAKHEGIPFI